MKSQSFAAAPPHERLTVGATQDVPGTLEDRANIDFVAKPAVTETTDPEVLESDLDSIAFGIAKRVLSDPIVDTRYFRTLKAKPPSLPPPPDPAMLEADTLRFPTR